LHKLSHNSNKITWTVDSYITHIQLEQRPIYFIVRSELCNSTMKNHSRSMTQ